MQEKIHVGHCFIELLFTFERILNRFDAKRLLEKLRGKRMVYVGDSLNRNQWVSMVCMVESFVPPGLKTQTYHGSLMSFKVEVRI